MTSVGAVTDLAKREITELTTLLKHVRQVKVDFENSTQQKIDLGDVDDDLTHLINLIKLRELLVALRDVGQSDHEMKSLLKNTSNQTVDTDPRLLQAADAFTKLAAVYKKTLKSCPEDNSLRIYVTAAFDHWNETLYGLLSKRFEKICQEISIVSPNDQSSAGDKPTTSVFDHFFTALLKIDMSSKDEPCLPMVLLAKQLEKRFHYHFIRPNKTNQLCRPEWYFSQVLEWIEKSREFLERNVDPLLRHQSDLDINLSARSMLSICLLKLLRIKLLSDLDELVKEPALFSHCYDEVLKFMRELESLLPQFNSVQNSVNLVNLFMDEPYFGCLMRLEKKKAIEYIECSLQSPDAFLCLTDSYTSEGEVDYKIPQMADQFALLLQAVIDRTYFIKNSSRKQAYFLLILDLIDDFRLRLYQLVREMLSDDLNDGPLHPRDTDFFIFPGKFFAIMNTLDYLLQVMKGWQSLSSAEAADVDTSIFISASESLQHILSDMESALIDTFEENLRIHLEPYSDVHWNCYDEDMDEISQVESSLLLFISRTLTALKQRLNSNLTQLIASIMAHKFYRLFKEVVVLQNKFNNAAALRIRQLVTRRLPTLFNTVLSNPANFLRELIELANVLSWSHGVYILLQGKDGSEFKEVLAENGIVNLSPDLVKKLLKLRIYS